MAADPHFFANVYHTIDGMYFDILVGSFLVI